MKQNIKIYLYSSLFLVLLFGGIFFISQNALAAPEFDPGGNLQTATGLGANDPQTIAITIINVILGLLSLFVLVMILFAGFMWMFSAGNSEKVNKARGILVNAIIGLAIVLASYGIANYVFGVITSGTG